MSGRSDALAIGKAAVRGADAGAAVRRVLVYEAGRLLMDEQVLMDVDDHGRVILIGAGKASGTMARALVDVVGERLAGGAIAVPRGSRLEIPGIDIWEAGHPLPSVGSVAAAAESLGVARRARAGDLVICLLSGGASALWTAPPPGIELGDVRETTLALLHSGAEISEINAVRQHISRIAGGRLALECQPARVLTLAVSDVGGAGPQVIGSGPTLPPSATCAEALGVLATHRIEAPPAVLQHLHRCAAEEDGTARMLQQQDLGDFRIVAGLPDALDAAKREADRLGYQATIVSDRLAGEARAAGSDVAQYSQRAAGTGARQQALIWGGETTVTVRGDGRGGRCQELAVEAARMLSGTPGITVLAIGTDGIDGPTPAAGGLVDGGTLERARLAGLNADEALARNDTLPFLQAADDLVVTGPTGTNVGDVVVALVD